MNSGFGQSCRGYYLLTMLGYPKIKVLHGGYDAWAAAGLPVTTDVPSPVTASFSIVPEAGDILIDAKTMLAAVGKPGIALLDVRDVDEWIGDSSSPYGKDFCPRKGRIPGAVWLEWYRMMKPTAEGPRFKSKDEILAECATVGITPNTPVYLYCFKGARASNTFLALKNAGVKDVRMYFGSWNEWSRDPSLPIEEGLPTDVRLRREGGIEPARFASPGRAAGGRAANALQAAALPFRSSRDHKGEWACPPSTIRSMPIASCHDRAASAASTAPRPSTSRRR